MIPFLSIHNLSISFQNRKALDNISLTLDRGECIAIVGESGSGKSTLAKALVGLNSEIATGEILYKGFDLLKLPEPLLRKYRGKEIAMIFQDSLSSLNPTMQIGKQILESYRKHHPKASKADEKKKVLQLLHWIGIDNPEMRYTQYPHQFSGGMRQRIIIAIALAAEPKILIADEPTSALDVGVQEQILDLLKKIQEELHMSIIFITHDLAIAAKFTSRILVLHEGKLIEMAATKELFANPQHPYTKRLLNSMPALYLQASPKKPISPRTLLEVSHLSFDERIPPLQDLSFSIYEGETLGLVGESGSGKTTLALLLMGLLKPTSGTILYKGSPREMQIVFQDPYSSLNPRMTVLEIIREPLIIHRIGTKEMQKDRVEELLYLVGLDPAFAKRYPHELSGGERQRVVIARALATRPKFLICDEPITSLDAPIAVQIIELFQELQNELGLTYLFISHDLATVKHLSDHIAVLYKGKIVEFGTTEELYASPKNSYAQSLLATLV